MKRLKHISKSDNRLRVWLHNVRCRFHYAWRIGLVIAIRHQHEFKRWTGADNLLCMCGAVYRPTSNDWYSVRCDIVESHVEDGVVVVEKAQVREISLLKKR